MRNGPPVAWVRFEIMMRTGVPHAMDIAAELVRHDLQTPLPTHVVKPCIDLQFYNVIHRAYRAGVLSRFLAVMALVRQSEIWDEVHSNQVIQLSLVQLCRESSRLSLSEANALILSRLRQPPAQIKGVA